MSHSGGQDGSNPMGSIERVQGGQLGATSEISGPQGTDGPAGAAAATEVVGTEAASGADGTAGVAGIAGAAELDGAHGVDGTGAITEALQAGEINADGARAALIEQAIAAHLPPDADPAVVDELRAELSVALADDPTLAGLLS